MNDEIPPELQDLNFPEIGNNQQNIWMLRDGLNATRKWLRENTVTPDENTSDFGTISMLEQAVCLHENSYQMRPGLMRCKDCKVIYKV